MSTDLVPFKPAEPINELFGIVAMARDLLERCDGGRQQLVLDGPVARTVLTTLIDLAESGARAANPAVGRQERGFAGLVQTAVQQGLRDDSVSNAWFMRDTPAAEGT